MPYAMVMLAAVMLSSRSTYKQQPRRSYRYNSRAGLCVNRSKSSIELESTSVNPINQLLFVIGLLELRVKLNKRTESQITPPAGEGD